MSVEGAGETSQKERVCCMVPGTLCRSCHACAHDFSSTGASPTSGPSSTQHPAASPAPTSNTLVASASDEISPGEQLSPNFQQVLLIFKFQEAMTITSNEVWIPGGGTSSLGSPPQPWGHGAPDVCQLDILRSSPHFLLSNPLLFWSCYN